jgi:hypothetical protein
MGSQRRKKPFGLAALLAVFFAILVFAPRENAQTVGPNQNDVLAHLNAAITWYRNLTTKVPTGAEPSRSAAPRGFFRFLCRAPSNVRFSVTRVPAYLLCLKNSTWRSLFSASALVLYGPPRFFPFSDNTL